MIELVDPVLLIEGPVQRSRSLDDVGWGRFEELFVKAQSNEAVDVQLCLQVLFAHGVQHRGPEGGPDIGREVRAELEDTGQL